MSIFFNFFRFSPGNSYLRSGNQVLIEALQNKEEERNSLVSKS